MTFCYYTNRSKPLSDIISEASSWRKIELTQRPTTGQWTLSERCWNTPCPKIFILCFFAYLVRFIPRYFWGNREWDGFPEFFLSIFFICVHESYVYTLISFLYDLLSKVINFKRFLVETMWSSMYKIIFSINNNALASLLFVFSFSSFIWLL